MPPMENGYRSPDRATILELVHTLSMQLKYLYCFPLFQWDMSDLMFKSCVYILLNYGCFKPNSMENQQSNK